MLSYSESIISDDDETFNESGMKPKQKSKLADKTPVVNHTIVQSQSNNLEALVTKSEDHFVLFLDPESRLYYRHYFNTQFQGIKVELLDEEPLLKAQLEERNKLVLYKLRKLLLLEKFSWNFKEADVYRRREFPLKFLQNECAPYPCYVFQSALSKAFDSDANIMAEIDLSEFSLELEPVRL